MADPVACVDCPTCESPRGLQCMSATGVPQKKPHAARVEACAIYVSDAYCQNEVQAGYGCGREGCPHCGGSTEPPKF